MLQMTARLQRRRHLEVVRGLKNRIDDKDAELMREQAHGAEQLMAAELEAKRAFDNGVIAE